MSTGRQPAAGQQGAKTSLMTFAFRQAFDLLAETTAAAAVEESRGIIHRPSGLAGVLGSFSNFLSGSSSRIAGAYEGDRGSNRCGRASPIEIPRGIRPLGPSPIGGSSRRSATAFLHTQNTCDISCVIMLEAACRHTRGLLRAGGLNLPVAFSGPDERLLCAACQPFR